MAGLIAFLVSHLLFIRAMKIKMKEYTIPANKTYMYIAILSGYLMVIMMHIQRAMHLQNRRWVLRVAVVVYGIVLCYMVYIALCL